ncbi:unnamed protein product [Psylliodes chrysocephalus]|uniref:Uncharacterized protein n=1 Tax=Psylliodes chrysocephalus TaxID=3402493 RepID=A0A9P0D4N5_9CUCU|nr:unnamed protein product [Psylliodes chrysocephala]
MNLLYLSRTGSNMSGEYSGLQARIKKHNAKALYILCAAHFLNLIGSCAAESCLQATEFFMLLNELYFFFSSSTARWDILKQTLSESENGDGEARNNLLPKKLSATRWSAGADATRALYSCYDSYQNALQNLVDDPNQPPVTKVQATGLRAAISKLETGILLEVWNKLLPKFDSVSKTLQKQSTDVSLVTKLYDSLILYVSSLRTDETFEEIEQNAKDLTKCNIYKLEVNRIRIRKQAFDDSKEIETNFDEKQNMKINTFYVILNNLSSERIRRQIAYERVSNTFGFMGSLCHLSDNQISIEAANLWQRYQSELDRDFAEECIQFKYFLKALKEENKE